MRQNKSKPKRGRLRPSISVLGRVDVKSLGPDAVADLHLFGGVRTIAEATERLRAAVSVEVAAIIEVCRDFDAFDVVELLRLREFPVVPVEGLRPEYDGSASVVEIVALLLLNREDRLRAGVNRTDTRPHEVISELHKRAKRLVRLATFMAGIVGRLRSEDELARLAAEYQAYFASVRGLQYDSVQVEHDSALFDRPELEVMLKAVVGFNHGHFLSVREAIQGRYNDILTKLRDKTAEVILLARAEGREPTKDEKQTFQDSMVAFIFLPGERAAFTAQDLSARSGITLEIVQAILDAFSIDFGMNADPVKLVMDYLRGVNPLARTCLMRDYSGKYLMTSSQVGDDCFRALVEAEFKKDGKNWRRYDASRATVSEELSLQCLTKLLKTAPTFKNFKYIAPKAGLADADLASDCVDPHVNGNETESDGLYVIEDVAFCVEIKGRMVADSARRGDLVRFRREVDDIVGAGAGQARRLEELIRANGGVWRAKGDWLDLSHVREVRSLVICLDFLGPLGVSIGDLERARVLAGASPWVGSLHDLAVISEVVDRPAEFLLFLRRRADSGVAHHYRGSDELDLFMLFMSGGLYTPPDPDEVKRLYPNSPLVIKKDRRDFRRANRPTLIGTFTDPLDAWMYWREGSSPFEVDKPKFNTNPDAAAFVDFLEDGRKPGWFRFGADLLGISGEGQKRLFDGVQQVVDRTKEDHEWHSLTLGFAGMWGYPTFFAGSAPTFTPEIDVAENLRNYMMAKKHQVGSDRSLGVLINEDHEITKVIYMNNPAGPNAELDTLGEALGLLPARQTEMNDRRTPDRRQRRKGGRRSRRRR